MHFLNHMDFYYSIEITLSKLNYLKFVINKSKNKKWELEFERIKKIRLAGEGSKVKTKAKRYNCLSPHTIFGNKSIHQ